ncbi:glycoside hydrolase family 88/105 protein [Saccharicrinis sp. 156]|uniref:glycoside hydrolase family 88/105 protein n=1 Tax=Saccharicrinis sp. 156 TaxID=3417574 RepID=UPI003D32C048
MYRIIFIIFFWGIAAVNNAQELPSKAEVLADLIKVNQYYMNANPETETVSSGASNWLEGSYFNGHMALFDLHPTQEGLDYALQWGINNDWNIGNRPHEADNQCVGQVYMDIYYAYGAKDTYMISKVGTSVSNLVNRTAVDDWDCIDALYMAMPVLTRYGIWNNDSRYFEKLYALYHSTKVSQGLYDASFGLWHRDKRFDPPYTTSGGKKCYWSRGNGWVFGGHVRTLKYLPENDIHRQEYIDTFKKMAEALKSVQRSDGFWNVSLGDPTEFPGQETSGTAFFVYGMAWGINNGLLDKETYLPTVIKGWNGLVSTALTSNGRIGYVQGVADEPKDAQPVTINTSREYGEGNFLLAGTEVIQLAEGEMPKPNDFFVKSVKMNDASILKIDFFEPAEKCSAQDVSSYLINKDVNVEYAIISQDGLSCELTLSNIYNGGYGISFNNITSVSGKTIANASGKY